MPSGVIVLPYCAHELSLVHTEVLLPLTNLFIPIIAVAPQQLFLILGHCDEVPVDNEEEETEHAAAIGARRKTNPTANQWTPVTC